MKTEVNAMAISHLTADSPLQLAVSEGLRERFFLFDRVHADGPRILLTFENDLLEAIGWVERLVRKIKKGIDVRLEVKSNHGDGGHHIERTPEVIMIRSWLGLEMRKLRTAFNRHTMNPALEAVISHNAVLSEYAACLGNDWLTIGPPVEYVLEVNAALTTLKSVLSNERLKLSEENFLRSSSKNLRSLEGYIAGLVRHHRNLQYVRIDLGYRPSDGQRVLLSPEGDHYLATDHYTRLYARLKRDFGSSMPGYIRKAEYSSGAGHHFHCLFFFSGLGDDAMPELAEEIGTYWSCEVTRGCGAYFNWNRPLPRDWAPVTQGGGRYPDLRAALLYLTKLDRYFRLSIGEARTLVRGKRP